MTTVRTHRSPFEDSTGTATQQRNAVAKDAKKRFDSRAAVRAIVVRTYRHNPYTPCELIDVPYPSVCTEPQPETPVCACDCCRAPTMCEGSMQYAVAPPYSSQMGSVEYAVPAEHSAASTTPMQVVYENGRPVLRNVASAAEGAFANHSLQDISFEEHSVCNTDSASKGDTSYEWNTSDHNAAVGEDEDETEAVVTVSFRHHEGTYQSAIPVCVGDHVIVEGDRGVDLGTVLSKSPQRVAQGVRKAPPEATDQMWLLRKATAEEMHMWQHEQLELENAALAMARSEAKRFGLDMDVLSCEFQFDRKKLSFQFESKGRVMFVPLAKSLHREFKCRIWLEQTNRRGGHQAASYD